MKETVKVKWLEALRSGEYKQGTKALKYKDDGVVKHCCLGVLCDIAVAEGVIPASVPVLDGDVGFGYGAAGNVCYLPTEVRVWADLEHSNPSIPWHRDNPYDARDLAGMNDRGATFEDIARIIEERL